MRAWVLLVAALAGGAEAQVQVPVDPKTTAGHGTAPQQSTAPSRQQFFSPVMGIQIEGQGLTLPKGVADEPLIPAPGQPTAQPASQPTAEPKAPEAPTQK